MSNNSSIFPANRNSATFIGLGVGYLIILVSIVPAVIFLPEKNLRGYSNLIVPFIFCAFFTFVLISSTIKILIKYELVVSGIKITKPLSRLVEINWKEIDSVEYLNDEKTQEILSDVIKSQFQLREDQDISGYIRLLRNKSPMYKYFTLVTQASVRTSGETGHLYSLNVKKYTGMVLLKLGKGEYLYLTPSDPERFVVECNKYIRTRRSTF